MECTLSFPPPRDTTRPAQGRTTSVELALREVRQVVRLADPRTLADRHPESASDSLHGGLGRLEGVRRIRRGRDHPRQFDVPGLDILAPHAEDPVAAGRDDLV